MMIEGSGILPNSSSCYIHADGFKLLPHSLGKTTVTLDKAHIVLPNIENLLDSKEEQNLLQLEAEHRINTQPIDDLIERAVSRGQTRGIDVSKFIAVARDRKGHHQPTMWLWILGVIVGVLVLAIVWIIRFKLMKVCCPTWRLRFFTPKLTSREMNTQTLTNWSEALQMTSPKEMDSDVECKESMLNQEVLTEFVRRRRVVTDHPE
jgi:hypothetical protein